MLSLDATADDLLDEVHVQMGKYRLVDAGQGSFGRLRDFLNVWLGRGGDGVLVPVELFGQGLDVSEHSGGIVQFYPALFSKHAVQLVEHVARPPRRPPVRDESVEEHAVGQPLDEVGLARASHAEKRGLVEGDVGRRVDADDGEAGSVALKDPDHEPEDDRPELLVQKEDRLSARSAFRAQLVKRIVRNVKICW